MRRNMLMKLLLLVALACAAAVIATADVRPAVASVAYMPDAYDLPFVSGCGACDDCERSDGTDGHVTCESGPGNKQLGPNGAHCEDCDPNSCEQEHPECSVSSNFDLPSIWYAVRQAAPEQIPAVLANNAEFTEYVPERRAVQVISCAGTRVAHIPLEPGQVAALSAD